MQKFWKVFMKLKKYDSINVIPFIDVLLVLLTIVLMTSTFISKGIIPISLPTATNANNLKVDKEIIIVIKEDGTIYCNNFIEGLDKIKEHILQFPKDTPIHINSDKVCGLHVPWNLQVVPADINVSKSNKLVV